MIDLHSHTTESDGTFTPGELVGEANRLQLRALAITDHDTFAGFDAAYPIAEATGLDLICGIEISTKFGGATVHLLAYFPSGEPDGKFREWLYFLHESRRDRNRRLIEKLRALDLDITLDEVETIGKSLTGRPHFARVLVDKGYATDMQHAFDEYLDESARGFVHRQEVPIDEAIERIVKAGGVASLAHPVRVARNNWEELDSYVGRFAEMGMKAIEVYHSDHSPENIAYYMSLAQKHRLVMTGGSDFHGANKPSIALGTGLRHNLAVPDDLLEPLRLAVK